MKINSLFFSFLHLHKGIYHTLFESHLTYSISVWGGVSESKIETVFKIQKKVMRILFGDTKAFIEKFKTCARARPFGNQKLGPDFFMQEHTKPLFHKHKILTVQNLYSDFTFMDVFKIYKFRMPISLFEQYEYSRRSCHTHIQIIPPKPSDNFIYRSSILWNSLRHKLGLDDLSVKR